MTICVAALANEKDKEHIVFATDHMISTGLGQFEHGIFKYKQINENTVAMLAGDALLFDDLVKVDDESNFKEIKTRVAKNFKNKRESIIQNQIFDIFCIDKDFFKECLRSPIQNEVIAEMLKKISELKLGSAILLVGFDNGIGKISEVTDGGCLNFRDINFHAIGSGAIQAMNTLLFQKHSKDDDLKSTIYDVYKAKRNAEVNEGVGKETELLVFNEDELTRLSDVQISILKDIYQAELEHGKNNDLLNELDL